MTSAGRGDDDRLVIYPSRAGMALALLGSIGFVALGLWFGLSDSIRNSDMPEALISLFVGVPFFGACGVYIAYRLVRRRPSLEIDSTGITDNASALATGHLRWDEVDHVVLYEYADQPMLGVVPRDVQSLLNRQPAARRKLIRANIRMGAAPVNIPQVALPMKLGELADLLHTRYGVRVKHDGGKES